MQRNPVKEPVDPRLRMPLLVSAVTFAATLALLPVADIPLAPKPAFLPAALAAVFGFHLISLCLLVGDYRDRGDRRILLTSCGYLAALLLITGYTLTLPGIAFENPMWVSSQSVTPYLYLFWHVVFPLVVGLAWAPWPSQWTVPTERQARVRRLVLALGVTGLLSVALTLACIAFAKSWPSLANGLDSSPLAKATGPVAIPLLAIVLLLSWDGVKERSGPERWVPVAVLMCLCDLVLASVESSTYTVGWYASRTLSVLTGAVLVGAMLTTFRRMKATAEYLAAFDALTGLPNQRNAYDVLRRMIARAQRSDVPLSLVVIRIDQVDELQSKRGSIAADAVIVASAERLSDTLRTGDTPARVGVDKFLVLLPDTTLNQAVHVAERLRIAVACLNVRVAGQRISASLGVATLRQRDAEFYDLVQRAKDALKEAEVNGRNQVVMESRHWEPAPEPDRTAQMTP